jgi:hypothetical protein
MGQKSRPGISESPHWSRRETCPYWPVAAEAGGKTIQAISVTTEAFTSESRRPRCSPCICQWTRVKGNLPRSDLTAQTKAKNICNELMRVLTSICTYLGPGRLFYEIQDAPCRQARGQPSARTQDPATRLDPGVAGNVDYSKVRPCCVQRTLPEEYLCLKP